MDFESLGNDDAWRVKVEGWLVSILNDLGVKYAGDLALEQQRPWSIVLLVPTNEGPCYFKASGPTLRHEASFTDWISTRFPTWVPEVLAIEPAQGWLLQRSAGDRLREAVESEGLLDWWRRILPGYASIQRQVQADIEELIQLGLPDRRPNTFASHLPRWVEALASAPATDVSITTGELFRLDSIQQEVEKVCRQLADLAPGNSINHGDLHDGNVAVDQDAFRLFDWGDASVSHPFFSLRSTFVSLENQLGWQAGDPGFVDLRRRYLEAWFEEHDIESMHYAFELSSKVWAIGTALGWEAALALASESSRAEYHYVLPSLMRELLTAFGREIDKPL